MRKNHGFNDNEKRYTITDIHDLVNFRLFMRSMKEDFLQLLNIRLFSKLTCSCRKTIFFPD